MADLSNSISTSRRLFLSAGPAAAVFGALQAQLPQTLAMLGAEFERLWTIERHASAFGTDDDLDAAIDECARIAGLIIAIPAKTLNDFKVKARALAWCYGGGDDDLLRDFFAGMQNTVDTKLARSIFRDLLAA